jgi:aspartate aminotransferase
MVILAQRMSELGTETAFEVLAKVERMRASGLDVINLGVGQPDFLTPDVISEAAQRALISNSTDSVAPPNGTRELRQAVSRRLKREYDLSVPEDHVVVGMGAKPFLFHIMNILGEPGAEILYPDPGFPIYASVIRFSGATPVPYPLREERSFEVDPEDILCRLSDKTRLIITNSPNNPTGGVITRETWEVLAEGLARWPETYLLSDEVYSRILYDDTEHVSALSIDQLRSQTILLDGFSKTFAMTGWRVGYAVLPPPLNTLMTQLFSIDSGGVSHWVQSACVEGLDSELSEPEEMRKEFRARRDIIVNGLNAIDGISCTLPKGAFYVFPNVAGTGESADVLCEFLLQKAHVAGVAGASFGSNGSNNIRFSYAASRKEIAEAVRRIGSALGS